MADGLLRLCVNFESFRFFICGFSVQFLSGLFISLLFYLCATDDHCFITNELFALFYRLESLEFMESLYLAFVGLIGTDIYFLPFL